MTVRLAVEAGEAPAPRWRQALRSRLVTQSAVFTVASALVLVLGAVGKALLANQMTPATFGRFAFCTSLLLFAALFFEFGLFTPAARRIARAEDGVRRKVIGASLLLFVPVAVLFSLAVVAISYTVEPIFGFDVGTALRVTAPLAGVYAFSTAASQIAQGADRIGTYALTGLAGQVCFVAGLLLLALTDTRVTITEALVLNAGGLLVMGLWFVHALHPVLHGAREHLAPIVRDTRRWGLNMYVGRVLSIGTYNMDVLMLAAFTGPRQVGFYVLATAIASGVGLPVQGLAASTFAHMSRVSTLDPRLLRAAWGIGLAGVLGTALLAGWFVDLVFSPAYHTVATLAVPLAMAAAVRGVTGIYNTFLSSQGRGRELRNCGFLLTGSNVVLNVTLIPAFGASGAAWASVLALLANLGGHIYYYRRTDGPRRALAGSVG